MKVCKRASWFVWFVQSVGSDLQLINQESIQRDWDSWQVFVNFRLWMVAESPFGKETVLAGFLEHEIQVLGNVMTSKHLYPTSFVPPNSDAVRWCCSPLCALSSRLPGSIGPYWTTDTWRQTNVAAQNGRLVVLAESPLGDWMQPQIEGTQRTAPKTSVSQKTSENCKLTLQV